MRDRGSRPSLKSRPGFLSRPGIGSAVLVGCWFLLTPAGGRAAPSASAPSAAAPSAAAPDAPSRGSAPLEESGPGEGSAEFREFRAALVARLSGEDRVHLDALSDEQLMKLLDSPRAAGLSALDQAVARAAGAEHFERQLTYQTGDITLSGGLAVLKLGSDFRYLSPEDSNRLLVDGWGNPPGPPPLGMIVPARVSPLADDGWAVIVTYAEDGYVDDEDAEELDYGDLLAEMQADTQAGNEQRKAQGYGALELVGWAEPPHYDAAGHRLYWAKELKLEGAAQSTLNYAIRVLGRKGVLELNAVAGMDRLRSVKREMENILPRAEFSDGQRYEDFDPDLDQVAAYGIGGLIAGKVLAKAGLFAGLLKLLVVGKKLILFGLLGVGAALAKFFKGRKGGQE